MTLNIICIAIAALAVAGFAIVFRRYRTMADENQALVDDKARIQTALTAANTAITNARGNIGRLQNQLLDAQADASNTRAINSALQERVDQLIAQVTTLTESWNPVAEQAESLQTAAEELETATKPAEPTSDETALTA